MAGLNWKYRKIDKVLRDNGFSIDRKKGDHVIYKRGENHISIPCSNCNGIMLQRLFKENDIKY